MAGRCNLRVRILSVIRLVLRSMTVMAESATIHITMTLVEPITVLAMFPLTVEGSL